jgi:CBS domain containing-hemolysin-like protein
VEIFILHPISTILMLLLLLVSAFFSGTETALFSLTREQIKRLRKEGKQVDAVLNLLTQNPSGLLTAILFGNIVANILFFSLSVVATAEASESIGEWGEAALGMGILMTVILTGEIIPKALGISFTERMIRLNALPLRGWYLLLGPLRRALEFVARRLEPATSSDQQLNAEELRLLIEATHHDATFGHQEKAIIEDIVNLPEIRVRTLMVPRVQQFFCAVDCPAAKALEAAAEQGREFIPVYKGEEDHIVGVALLQELFCSTNPQQPLGKFLHPVRFVPETKRADDMLREFLSENLKMACVVDEYGGLAGTIILEYLLEEVVGEFDALETPPVEKLNESTYRLQGSLGIREWRNLFVGFLPDEEVRTLALDTLSGLVVSLLKGVPKPGDKVQVGNLRFTVERVRENRIESVLLQLVGEPS